MHEADKESIEPDGSCRAGRRHGRAAVSAVTAGLSLLLAVAILASACSSSGGQKDAAGAGADVRPSTITQAEADASRVADIRQVSGPGPVPLLSPAADGVTVPESSGALAGRVICIDPGHASTTDSGTEPIGPGAAEMKVRDPGGTSGVVTGVREPVVTLAISLQLKRMLEAEGATVVMTRSGTGFTGGNRERAQIANEAGAELFIRVHADGSDDPSRSGVSTLYPAAIPGWTDDIFDASRSAAMAVQPALAAGLGATDLGTVARSDISGFNWSDVPAILVEVGFMSNPVEDQLLNEPAYQQQVAAALFVGLRAYFA